MHGFSITDDLHPRKEGGGKREEGERARARQVFEPLVGDVAQLISPPATADQKLNHLRAALAVGDVREHKQKLLQEGGHVRAIRLTRECAHRQPYSKHHA